ncbi:hypothetical protein OAS19_02665 [Altererythrobacter sp.]|nr:hypothetical protein [Altererythrobacter sp.]
MSIFQLFLTSREFLQTAAFVGLAGIALLKGGGPERATALTLLAMLWVDDIYHMLVGPHYALEAVDAWHMFVDLSVLAALIGIALRANRLYPLALAAAQIVAFTAHIARLAVEQMSSLSYYLLYVMPSYFQLIILAIGIWRHFQRVREIGPYRAWRVRNGAPPTNFGYS